MDKSSSKNELTINEWPKGIAEAPLVGFGNIRNLDITTNPGSIRLNQVPVVGSGGTTGLTISIRRDPTSTSNYYAAQDNGSSSKVYKSTDGGATWNLITGSTGASIKGMALWQDYLIVNRAGSALDVYGPLSGSAAWTNSWKNLSASDSGYSKILESIDGNLYVPSGRYIDKLAWADAGSVFNPATAGTYTFTTKAITLASNYRIKTLADLGQFLMIGTWQGTNLTDFKVADIFPYSRASLTLGIPLKLNKNGVNAMISVNNRLYIQAGVRGELFESDGVSVGRIWKISNYMANLDGGVQVYGYPEAIMLHQDKIFFGLSSSNSVANMGVYSYNLLSKAAVYENSISTGNDGTTNALLVSALLSTSPDTFLIGWQDNASFGIDALDNLHKYTGYLGYFDSGLYTVGEALNNRTIKSIETYFQKPLVSGQGFRIKYRTDLTSSFTTLATIDFATYGGITSYNVPAAVITNAVFVQIRGELTTGVSNASPEVSKVLLKLNP